MEHIVQFAIGIDDEAVTERVIAAATNELIKDVKSNIYKKGYYSSGFTDTVENIIKTAVSEYKDEIVDRASEMLFNSIRHSKKYKEIVSNVLTEEK